MFVRIKDILPSPGLWKDYSNSEEIDCSELATAGPIEVNLHLTNAGTRILVQGRVEASIIVECSRCNDSFPLPLDLEIEEFFLHADSPEANVEGLDALDILTYKEERIVLDEMLRQNFLAAIPMQPLCHSGSCLGLCDQCGTNLNESSCSCAKEELDPRWASLSELHKRHASNPGLN